MPAKVRALRILGHLLRRLPGKCFWPSLGKGIISRGWFPHSGCTSSRCLHAGHVSTLSKVERIKFISFMTRGKFEIGSSETKRERGRSSPQGSRVPTSSPSLPWGFPQCNWGGIPPPFTAACSLPAAWAMPETVCRSSLWTTPFRLVRASWCISVTLRP